MSSNNIKKILIGVIATIILSLMWGVFGLKVDDLINVSIMVVLCIGFTFTYMMEGFPNFAHTGYAMIGGITSFYLATFHSFNPYYTWPFSILVGGTLGVILYVLIVHRINQRGGNQSITLTFTFLAITTILGSLSYIFSYWVSRVAYGSEEYTLTQRARAIELSSAGYNLSQLDFRFNNIPGIVIVGVGTCLMIAIYMYYFLTKTTTGISLRALSEDEELAEVLGINSYRSHCLAWFISGGLAALAGSIIVINQGLSPQDADLLIVTVMTGSIFGGLNSVFGAVIGGVFVTFAQKVFRTILFWAFGLPVLNWISIYPTVFLILTLFLFPNGIMDRQKSQNKWLKLLRARLDKDRYTDS